MRKRTEKGYSMPRQTISISDPNRAWLQRRVESGEFRTQTEAVNDALQKVREMESNTELLRAKLVRAEERGFSSDTPDEILTAALDSLRNNGAL